LFRPMANYFANIYKEVYMNEPRVPPLQNPVKPQPQEPKTKEDDLPPRNPRLTTDDMDPEGIKQGNLEE
jgi:hypothetical protein